MRKEQGKINSVQLQKGGSVIVYGVVMPWSGLVQFLAEIFEP